MTRRADGQAGSGGRRPGLPAFGAGASRPVERREAQRPAGRPRKPAGYLGARASRTGLASPPGLARETGASQAPERGLASPWRLPALHSSSRKGKRDRRTRRLSNNTGGGALADSIAIAGLTRLSELTHRARKCFMDARVKPRARQIEVIDKCEFRDFPPAGARGR
jgi:hypothetical protein